MPMYQYKCEECGQFFEELVFNAQTKVSCLHCESPKVQRQISVPGFHLKGDGWYSDHYGLKSNASPPSDSTKSTSSPSTSVPSTSGDKS